MQKINEKKIENFEYKNKKINFVLNIKIKEFYEKLKTIKIF